MLFHEPARKTKTRVWVSQQEANSSLWGGKDFCFLHCGVLLRPHGLHSRESSAELGTHSLDFPYKHLFLRSVGAAFLPAQQVSKSRHMGVVNDQTHCYPRAGHVAATIDSGAEGRW